MIKQKIRQYGFTLIETLIYITLLSILIIEVFSSVYMIMHSESSRFDIDKDNAILIQNEDF